MSDPDHKTVKRRLAGEGRPPPEIGRMSPEVALGLALARAGEDSLGLELFAKSVTMSRTVIAPMIDEIPEASLITLISAPGNRFGLAVFDPQCLAGLIEKQTTGRVVPKPTDPRPPTRTDAVMCVDFLNAVLNSFQSEGEDGGLALVSTWRGFEYVLPLEDGRAVQMALEDIPYRKFEAVLDMDKSAKEGRVVLLFPFFPPRAGASDGAPDEAEEGQMGELVQDSSLEMDTVLHRCELSLADVTQLEVGSMIPVPRNAVVQIAIEDINGQKICEGRLGAKSGHRAIRLNLTDTSHEAEPTSSPMAAAMPPGDGLPALGGTPMTELGGTPMTGLGGMPMTEPGGAPMAEMGDGGLAGLGDGGGPDMPAPDQPAMDEMSAIDGLPPLGDLPDLSDVPDLPDLPALDPAQ